MRLRVAITILMYLFLFGCFGINSQIIDKNLSSTTSQQPCVLGVVLTSDCLASPPQIVTSTMGSQITSWNNLGASTSIVGQLPDGFYKNQICSFTDEDLITENILAGTNVFGVSGIYPGNFSLHTASNAFRNPGVKVISNLADNNSTSTQLNMNAESTTYEGLDFPTSGGYFYRDIADGSQDDDGESGVNCKYAPRPSIDCGLVQTTLSLRIADCQAANPSSNSWDGATQCNAGQGLWRLVARNGVNKEVWQDQRTGLIWSSVVNTATDWCEATGNVQQTPLVFNRTFNTTVGNPIIGNGTIGSLSSGSNSDNETITITFSDAVTFSVTGTAGAAGCQGGGIVSGVLTTTPGSTITYSDVNECSFTITQGAINFSAADTFILKNGLNASYSCVPGGPLQPASPISYCAEAVGLNSGVGDDWTTPVYMAAKGGLGKNSVPSVRWRAPTLGDFNLADINGLRFVIPDAGLSGVNRPNSDGSQGAYGFEWTSTLDSDRDRAWRFNTGGGTVASGLRNGPHSIRCVGR